MRKLQLQLLIASTGLLILGAAEGDAPPAKQKTQDIPVAAPLTTSSAGTAGEVAVRSVVRVLCPSADRGATGFLHESGRVITANHVVSGCQRILVVPAFGSPIEAIANVADPDVDLAVLTLTKKLDVPSLPLSTQPPLSLGAQVTTWGFPGGYRGRAPLLSVGYLSGFEEVRDSGKEGRTQWVVNAAFNLGNSGGPLLDIETGSVIGVVSSKLAPVPDSVEKGIKALDDLEVGVTFTITKPDGTAEKVSQGRVIASVLNHLRSQVQLVIGKATPVGDLKRLLKENGIEP